MKRNRVEYPNFYDKGPTPCSQVDPDMFFPDSETMENPEQARRVARDAVKVCSGCPYMQECFLWAIQNEQIGVWGGTTERQRNLIKRDPIRARLGRSRNIPRQVINYL